MRSLIFFLFFLFNFTWLFAESGRIFLHNGKELAGDIERSENGSYLVCYGNGSIRFEKSEVRKVILDKKQRKNKAKETFVNALKITPGQSYPANSGPSTPYDNAINKAAAKHAIDPALIKAVIKAESNFKAEDISYKGACGLMQLMPSTGKLLGLEKKNLFVPEDNINAGTRYLKDMLYIFGGDVDMALAAYNAGPGAVSKYKAIPPYKETKAYVKNVQKFYKKYKRSARVLTYTDENGCLNIYNVR